jgi:hypothetical protein
VSVEAPEVLQERRDSSWVGKDLGSILLIHAFRTSEVRPRVLGHDDVAVRNRGLQEYEVLEVVVVCRMLNTVLSRLAERRPAHSSAASPSVGQPLLLSLHPMASRCSGNGDAGQEATIFTGEKRDDADHVFGLRRATKPCHRDLSRGFAC